MSYNTVRIEFDPDDIGLSTTVSFTSGQWFSNLGEERNEPGSF